MGGHDGSGIERTADVERLGRALTAVGELIGKVRPEQWSGPTPCTDWTVRRLVDHLIGMNRVFTALLDDQPPPRRDSGHIEEDPVGAYRDSAAALQSAFEQPGVLQRTFRGPLGAASGAERLHIRLYDLLAHGWDLAKATGQPVALPEDAAEQALAFVRTQLTDAARAGRFDPAQSIADDAPATDRLAAFLGRPVGSYS